MTAFAGKLKVARKGSGLSLRQLAAKIGVSAMAISKWERGVSTPTSTNVIAVADALNVRPSWLLRESPIKLDSFRITHVCRINDGEV